MVTANITCIYTGTYLYNVIIKQQPEVVAFHNGNVVSPVWTTEKKKNAMY